MGEAVRQLEISMLAAVSLVSLEGTVKVCESSATIGESSVKIGESSDKTSNFNDESGLSLG